jgi:hypothetical protein
MCSQKLHLKAKLEPGRGLAKSPLDTLSFDRKAVAKNLDPFRSTLLTPFQPSIVLWLADCGFEFASGLMSGLFGLDYPVDHGQIR